MQRYVSQRNNSNESSAADVAAGFCLRTGRGAVFGAGSLVFTGLQIGAEIASGFRSGRLYLGARLLLRSRSRCTSRCSELQESLAPANHHDVHIKSALHRARCANESSLQARCTRVRSDASIRRRIDKRARVRVCKSMRDYVRSKCAE